jgi:hypothetical protein
MARYSLPEMSPWRRHALTIPPDSADAWIRLVVWECWMGILLYGALSVAAHLVATAPDNVITVFDLKNCYAAAVVLPCERVTYRAGFLNMALNLWLALLLITVAAWMLWELWNAAAPKPITDEFLKLLDDSFGRDWRRPRTWPWARVVWAYGFTLAGAASAVFIGLLISTALSSGAPVKAATPRVDTSQQFRVAPTAR